MAHEVKENLLNKSKGKKIQTKSVTQEKIEECKKRILKIVEDLLDPSVSEELFVSLCASISESDYIDVIEERNILLYCGYPLCANKVKQIKQKYHISLKSNKVFDITDRKCFCSNTCFKASNYLKAQLPSIPIWLKETDRNDETIHLLSSTKNRGSVGDEIDLGHNVMTVKDIEKVFSLDNENHSKEKSYEASTEDGLHTCSSALEKLIISDDTHDTDCQESTFLIDKEHADEMSDVTYVEQCDGDLGSFSEPLTNQIVSSAELAQREYMDAEADLYSSELVHGHERYESLILDNKYMPIIPKDKIRKIVLIDPLQDPECAPKRSSDKNIFFNPLQVIKNTLMSWITAETFFMIYDETKYETIKNEILKRAKASSSVQLNTNHAEKFEAMQESYAKICLKLEKEEAIELAGDSAVDNQNDLGHENVTEKELGEKKESLDELKVSTFQKGEMGLPERNPSSSKNKSLTTAKPGRGRNYKKKDSTIKPMVPIKTKGTEPVVASTEREFSVLPLIESLSQTTIRRRIVASRLKIVYEDILPLVGLHYHDVRENVQLLISTFSLSATNISLKPSEWKMIAVILLRMIETKLSTEKVWAQEKCWKLLQKKLMSFDISLDQIDSAIATITHCNNFKKLLLGK